jgi:hypothetical protein
VDINIEDFRSLAVMEAVNEFESSDSPLLASPQGVHHVEGGSESLTGSGKKERFPMKKLSKPGTPKGDSLEQLYFRWM